jgi:hypothetical protein
MQQDYFEQLLQALLRQQQAWKQLQEENWELRRQLTNLRAAQGLVLVIEGKRFVVKAEGEETAPTTEPVAGPVVPQGPVSTQTGAGLPKREETTSNTAASQQTRPMALRPRSAPQEEPGEAVHQEEKARLQRELAGSFVLVHEE